ncbi:MAG: DUF4340 domain-containing protein [Saprospiraceae bacterium]|nr:DUF4340 domain-containing protein [Bacteroidia bacterium]NNE16002.1 DUF4340 domain-containing protein [Saprospiraceae bacterium]NNL93858.1 DUF4340 domain-containing protein [Saprospiraceae bacterium]
MKFNNKILGIIFIGLLALYFIKKVVSKPEVRSFKEVLVSVDTASVNKLIYYPKGGSPVITLQRNGSNWTANNGTKTVDAVSGIIQSMLAPTTEIKPLQLISKSKEKWADYEVDDASGKKVELYNGDKLLSSFYVGRFNFNQNTKTAKTYMRLSGEDDIYIIDGFLSMTYEKQFDDFRNKNLFNGLNSENITGLKISGDVNIGLGKDISGQWIDDEGLTKDSLSVARYIQSLSNARGSEIIDDYSPHNNLISQINISTKDNINNQNIDIYKEGDNSFIMKSSSNDVFFKTDSSGIFKSLYLDLKELL